MLTWFIINFSKQVNVVIMNCMNCDGNTKVKNSRHQVRSNQVWRRRQCLKCKAVFTTEETIYYQAAWLVRDKLGAYMPFMPDKLVLSLNKSLQHRPTALSDAIGLSHTIIRKLQPQFTDGMIDNKAIVQVTQVALNRFDHAASVHYEAHHRLP